MAFDSVNLYYGPPMARRWLRTNALSVQSWMDRVFDPDSTPYQLGDLKKVI